MAEEEKAEATQSAEQTVPEKIEKQEATSTTPAAAKPNKKKSKLLIIIGIVVGVLVLLVILIVIFGSPSTKSVFKDMNAKMLQTKTVAITQSYKGTGSSENIDMSSKIYLDMTSSQTLKTKGDFTVNIVSGSTPMTIKAEFISIGDSKYIKFSQLTSSDSTIAATFAPAEAKLKGQWIKARSVDSYSTFASVPLDSVLTVLPTPFANLTKDQQTNVLKIIQDKTTYTIEESSKVELGNTNAYKYVLSYDKNQYNLFAKEIVNYAKYFKTSDSDNSELKTYNVWVDTSSKQIAKIEFAGTSKQGDVEGKYVFSNYNEALNINKPDDYSIESELLQ